MRKPEFVTFTGIDDRTDLSRAKELARRYPIEWGLLLSVTHQGKRTRYPKDIKGILDFAMGPVAAHLCGHYSRSVMKGAPFRMPVPADSFARIQVNSRTPSAKAIKAAFPGKRVAAQWHFVRGFPLALDGAQDIEWLFDPSGGKGERPASWPAHPGGRQVVGYAGGIAPNTVAEVLEEIDCGGPYWIDMESGVRTDEWFDLDKCEAVCRAVFP